MEMSQTNHIFSIANLTFDAVGADEKALYSKADANVYEGYKPKQTWVEKHIRICG